MKSLLSNRSNKKAAIELSVTTVIIIVIGVSLLILGMFLVRNIMCGAIGLTGTSLDKAKDELNRLFGSAGGEVVCLGSVGEAVKMSPGQQNYVYCSVKATAQNAKYQIAVDRNQIQYKPDDNSAAPPATSGWILDSGWGGTSGIVIPPGDDEPKTILVINVPTDSPDMTIIVPYSASRNGQVIKSNKLYFKVSRSGFFRAAVC